MGRDENLKGRQRMLQAAVVGLALAGVACGSTSIDTPRPSPTPTHAPTPTAAPTPTPDPTTTAILNAYDQAVAAWNAAAAIPDPNYAGISQWYANPQYTQAYTRLLLLAQGGFIAKGSLQPHAIVSGINGSIATVLDCDWDTGYYVSKANGSTPSPQPFGGTVAPGWDDITATMVLSPSGRWQLSSQEVKTNTTCSTASS